MRTRVSLLLTPVATVTLVAGFHLGPSSKPSARDLVSDAANAITAAKSFRLSGTIGMGNSEESVDIEIFSNNDLTGSFVMGMTPLKIEVVGNTAYFQAPASYWQSVGHLPATVAKQISPDWISSPNSGPSGFGTSFEFGPLASSLKSTAGLSLDGSKKVDGQQATGIRFKDGSVVWIANSTPHRPIEIVKTGKAGGTLTFSGWNAFGVPSPPKHAVPLSSFSK